MQNYLQENLSLCQRSASQKQCNFSWELIDKDFVLESSRMIASAIALWNQKVKKFSHCIMNPPYKKILSSSRHRTSLRAAGIETINLYSAFVALSVLLLEKKGYLVAIIPRSFCNGPYYRPFRELILKNTAIKRIHLFDSRNKAFKEDKVLQENIIIALEKGTKQGPVSISTSTDDTFTDINISNYPFSSIVKDSDSELFIHIPTSPDDVLELPENFNHSLSDIGVNISTGPVVDFRMKEHLRQMPEKGSVPLLYPCHFKRDALAWPLEDGKKPNAIMANSDTQKWLYSNGFYTVVRRFSSKEEKRRIVASIVDPRLLNEAENIGLENHLNVFHEKKKPLAEYLARGLAVYLNSTIVDEYFRRFSGHTQVNATDLKLLTYPCGQTLLKLGEWATEHTELSQEMIDHKMEKYFQMNQTESQKYINDAIDILVTLGMPRAQQNERSALCLLALLNLSPGKDWHQSENPLMGITPIMDWAREHYNKEYAPNTRETVRRQSMHQFVDAGIALYNPDKPDRPVNSPKAVYQIEGNVLSLLKSFETDDWHDNLTTYLSGRETLAAKYAMAREQNKVAVKIAEGKEISLSPGEHSELIRDIIEEFGPIFVPGGALIYAGDTGDKWGYFDAPLLTKLGISVDSHGKMPDVVLYCKKRNWLLLIESVTSHGPVDGKRHAELSQLFSNSMAGLVYVTAFPNRSLMGRYLKEIAWETEIWVADAPSHLIHFNGERFLGPHSGQ